MLEGEHDGNDICAYSFSFFFKIIKQKSVFAILR